MKTLRSWASALSFLAVVAGHAPSIAAGAPGDLVAVRHPWVVPPPDPTAQAYFLDLKDGDRIETPLIIRFGLSGRGLAPAEVQAGKAGHHHLLIDFPIPRDLTKPLPFTDNYIHFGAGQMQTVLKLKPGTYQLALVLSDRNHVPYPVHSKPIKVTVTKFDPNVNVWRLYGTPRVEIRHPTEGESVHGPFRVNFHASAFNVGAAQAKVFDTGHFRLNIDAHGKPPEVLEFSGGETEVWLKPPPGDYTLRLELLSNQQPGTVMTAGQPVHISVR